MTSYLPGKEWKSAWLLRGGKFSEWTVSADEETEDSPPGMGIKFIYAETREREFIEGKVERLMIDSLGRHLYEKLLKRHEG